MARRSTDHSTPSERSYLSSETRHHWRLIPQLTRTTSKVISVLGEDGTIRYQNHVMCRLLDYEAGEAVGRPLTHLLHPHSKSAARVSIGRMARQEATFDAWTLRFYTASKNTIWLEGLASNFLKDPRLGGIMVYWRRINT